MSKCTNNISGARYDAYYIHNSKKKEYDWKHNYVIPRLMSHTLAESNNVFVQYILSTIETSLGFIMSYIEKLKDFKNYNKMNR